MGWEKLMNRWGIDTGWLQGISADGRLWRSVREKAIITIWLRKDARWGRINDIANIETIDDAKRIVESAGAL